MATPPVHRALLDYARREGIAQQFLERRDWHKNNGKPKASDYYDAAAEDVLGADWRRVIEPLVHKRGRQSGPVDWDEEARWVYQNLDSPEEGPFLGAPPSPGSVKLLAEARKDVRWFFEKVYQKMIPSKEERKKAKQRFSDDGRGVLELIEKIERNCAHAVREGAEGTGG